MRVPANPTEINGNTVITPGELNSIKAVRIRLVINPARHNLRDFGIDYAINFIQYHYPNNRTGNIRHRLGTTILNVCVPYYHELVIDFSQNDNFIYHLKTNFTNFS